MSGNRAPGTIWSVGWPKDLRAYVRTTDDDRIRIAVDVGGYWSDLIVDRQTARMIARRINECLDATVKR